MSDQRTLTALRKLIVDTVNADPHLPWGHLDDEMAEQIAAAVLAQFEGLESVEVATEWGVRWPDVIDRDDEWCPTEEYARQRWDEQAFNGASVVHRQVRRGPVVVES